MAKQYDKIIKENLQELIVPLIRKTLQIEAVAYEVLPDKLEHTLEREADFVQRITTKEGEVFILHLEFQTANDRQMLERMLHYFARLYKTYRIPIRQFVFYIGESRVNMTNQLQLPDIRYQYRIINLRDYPYQTFLESDIPEEVILAVLADFKEEDRNQVVRKILSRLREIIEGSTLMLQQRIKQLEIFSILRSLQQTVIDEERTMALDYPIEKDIRFQQGIAKGMEKGIEKGREEGIEKGMEEGIERGMEKGIERGKLDEKVKIAIGMLKEGLDIQLISKPTGLSVNDLNALQKG